MATDKYDLHTIDYSVQGWDTIMTTDMEKLDDVIHSRIAAVAGETIAQYDVVYPESDGKCDKALADGSQQPAIGLALESAVLDDDFRIQRIGPITNIGWSWGTIAAKVYLDASTPGALTDVRPSTNAQRIGFVLSATKIFIDIDFGMSGDVDGKTVGQVTPAVGSFTLLKASTNPTVDGDVGNRGYNDSRYALVAGAAAGKLHFDVVECNISAVKKGQALACCSSGDGVELEVCLCDCDDPAKIRMIGLSSTDIVQDGAGVSVYKGILEGVDTRATNLDVNPNAETWTAMDCLYVSNTAGGLTNVIPTSGRKIKAGVTIKGSDVDDTIISLSHVNPIYNAAASGEDHILRMGDSAGSNKISFRDYANNEVASMDSDGKLIIPSPLYSTYWTSRTMFLDENNANDNGVPTQIERGLFKGYSFPIWSDPAQINEELTFRIRVPHRWDGTTKPWFVAITAISGAEDIGDKYKFQLEWQSKDVENVIPATIQETLTTEITVADGTAWYAEILAFELTATTIVAGQNMQLRLRRIAASANEVANEPVIFHWDSRWKMNRIGSVTIQGYPP